MFILGAATLGGDGLGGAVESIKINDFHGPLGSLSPQAFLRFEQDSRLLIFPAADDVGLMQRDQAQEHELANALSGVRVQANLGGWDEVQVTARDLSSRDFQRALESWIASARTGRDFAYGFDLTDQVFACARVAVDVGDTFIELTDTGGIVAGRTYRLRRDILGANATKNLAPNGGFNAGVASVLAVGSTIVQDTVVKTEGAGSCKVTPGGSANQGMSETIPVPARVGFFTFSAKVRAVIGNAMKLRLTWVEDGTTVTKDLAFTGNDLFQLATLTVRVPVKTITNLAAQVLTGGATADPFWVDEFQVEPRGSRTPFADSGLTTFSVSTTYIEEPVIVREVVPGTGVVVRDPVRFSYAVRDVLKAERYWPRLTLVSPSESPFTQNILTFDLDTRAREVPA